MIISAEHFSFTVSNINEALHFFCDVLGLKASPVMEVKNEEVQQIIGIPGAHLRTALVQLPDEKNIELIEYVKPKGKKIDLKTNNTGVAHIAFQVDDIQKIYDNLSNKGVKFISQPVWLPGNDSKGRWAVCYLKGPDDITMELIEKKSHTCPN